MSFPLSAPPSEPQSRGHFYWALKGTLSLGFNRCKGQGQRFRNAVGREPGSDWGTSELGAGRAGRADSQPDEGLGGARSRPRKTPLRSAAARQLGWQRRMAGRKKTTRSLWRGPRAVRASRRLIQISRHRARPKDSRLAAPQRCLEIARNKNVEEIKSQKHRQQKVLDRRGVVLIYVVGVPAVD